MSLADLTGLARVIEVSSATEHGIWNPGGVIKGAVPLDPCVTGQAGKLPLDPCHLCERISEFVQAWPVQVDREAQARPVHVG